MKTVSTRSIREIEIKGKKKRTEWKREKKSGRLVGAARDQQRACRMAQTSSEKLKHTGPAKKERVATMPQREQLASTPEPLFPNEKEQSRLSDHQIARCERVKVSESRILAREREGSEREQGEESIGFRVKEIRRREDKQRELS